MPQDSDITRHYASEGIAERILAALRAASGSDAPVTPDTLAPLDHFHGRGLQATQEIVALLKPQPDENLLDIGSGIGGPARWIASHCGCRVIGVDLTEAFCNAARALNEATGMADRVRILHGSATALPVADAGFDRAYSQNVVMNIADKMAFYREARRALRPGGLLALSNICAGPNGEPYYPVPWANSAATSFLVTPEQTRRDVAAAGFETVSFTDTTVRVAEAQAALRRRIETEGLPALGMHILMGPRMRELQQNSMRGVQEGRLATIEVLLRKPG
ncbi:MAG TPA: class I SAM-dependent methyltransferase [Candidatus Cybelea sp.]|nr:class I SAM-dependent methyltransferase [Candidatus Cybelea sp.]